MSPRLTCAQCFKPKGYCYCAQIQICNNTHPVWILQHPNESKHAIGTAHIAHLSLQHSQICIAKKLSDNVSFLQQIQIQKPLLVFPSEKSIALTQIKGEIKSEINSSSPRPLLFIDATWRKAKRMVLESPELSELTHVRLDESVEPRYKIRKVPVFKNLLKNKSGKSEETFAGLSTLEAIVYTLRQLEGDTQKYESLLKAMDWVVQRQIDAMGEQTFKKNYTNNRVQS